MRRGIRVSKILKKKKKKKEEEAKSNYMIIKR